MQCIELLIGQYLGALRPNRIEILLKIIENFKVYSGDNNINYMSCDMLWKIGDYLNNLEIREDSLETSKNTLK